MSRRMAGKAWVVVLVGICVVGAAAMAVGIAVGAGAHAVVSRKPIPMLCKFRAAWMDNGFVAVCTNGSGELIRNMRVTCQNPALKQQKVLRYDSLAAGGWFEIGHAEGWSFAPGETITFEADDFAPIKYTFTK